jgi:asparagine synthase (glutamine-hydrolysing)
MLLRMQHHLDGYDRGLALDLINPLVSQPIVEAALAVPSWRMVEGGVNRAMARAAFAARLPQDILSRRTKAGPDSFIVQLLDHRLSDIRERLLHGQLAVRGLLDRDGLGAALRPGDRRNPRDYMRVMALLDTEAWIVRWQDAAKQCASLSPPGRADAVAS